MFGYRILILASAVFYYGKGDLGNKDPASLFDAYNLIRDRVGQCESSICAEIIRDLDLLISIYNITAAATLFAIALLASGQVSLWFDIYARGDVSLTFPYCLELVFHCYCGRAGSLRRFHSMACSCKFYFGFLE